MSSRRLRRFLSSNAQDFIEESIRSIRFPPIRRFLSSNAQDFIEDRTLRLKRRKQDRFLSSNAQDFIEETSPVSRLLPVYIPEQ